MLCSNLKYPKFSHNSKCVVSYIPHLSRVSFLWRKPSSSQAICRLRRAFLSHCKTHRVLVLLLLAFAKSHAQLQAPSQQLAVAATFLRDTAEISFLTVLCKSKRKQQTLIQKQLSFWEGCFCVYARKTRNYEKL